MTMATRREFILLAAAVSAGCVAGEQKMPEPGAREAIVRPPAIGQTWRYAKRDLFTGAIVDTQIDRVARIGTAIEIESHSERAGDIPMRYPTWGDRWRHEYLGDDTIIAPASTEVQKPWGMIVVDPHWSELQAFERPIPLWPSQLRPGWSAIVGSYYRNPNSAEAMPSQLSMRAQRWESITVPAGQFTALRYYNIIDFRFRNASERTAALRQENIWLAPEIGRWVVRESRGTFREDVGYEVKEGSYRWELISWT
jgi:hypothetical protein